MHLFTAGFTAEVFKMVSELFAEIEKNLLSLASFAEKHAATSADVQDDYSS